MEDFMTFVFIIFIIIGILQIILFFKVWGMTNDVSAMKNILYNIYSKKEKSTQPNALDIIEKVSTTKDNIPKIGEAWGGEFNRRRD